MLIEVDIIILKCNRCVYESRYATIRDRDAAIKERGNNKCPNCGDSG